MAVDLKDTKKELKKGHKKENKKLLRQSKMRWDWFFIQIQKQIHVHFPSTSTK